MDFINISSSMTMLDLVIHLLQGTTNSFSFYSGKLGDWELGSNGGLLTAVCEYICKKVREEWPVHNIGITALEDQEVMICVTSSDSSAPAEVVSFMVEAVAVATANLSTVTPKTEMLEMPEVDESMEGCISPDLIQVNATMAEIHSRIDQFITYKRQQANINNVLDFCGPPEESSLCARVDAVLVRKKNSSSHMAVRNVLDRYTCKYNSEKHAANMKSVSNTTAPFPSTSQVQLCNSQFQIPGTSPKGEKRTFDGASIQSTFNISIKHQKT